MTLLLLRCMRCGDLAEMDPCEMYGWGLCSPCWDSHPDITPDPRTFHRWMDRWQKGMQSHDLQGPECRARRARGRLARTFHGGSMTTRPLSLCPELVPAVLSGLKTTTRRPLNPQPIRMHANGKSFWCFNLRNGFVNSREDGTWPASMVRHHVDQDGEVHPAVCPLGAPGDGLWLRERARVVGQWDRNGPPRVRVRYEADGTDHLVLWPDRLKPVPLGRCIPSGVHKEGSRWTGIIEEVRIERVQDITEVDARAEGVARNPNGTWMDYFPPTGSSPAGWDDPRGSFRSLWRSIYGPDAWDANPWVWVVRWKGVR